MLSLLTVAFYTSFHSNYVDEEYFFLEAKDIHIPYIKIGIRSCFGFHWT